MLTVNVWYQRTWRENGRKKHENKNVVGVELPGLEYPKDCQKIVAKLQAMPPTPEHRWTLQGFFVQETGPGYVFKHGLSSNPEGWPSCPPATSSNSEHAPTSTAARP